MDKLETYYNKFNEEKRLTRRHGNVEYITSMKYIHEILAMKENPKILDIGAGTGRYSVSLANEGYDVTAVELIKFNLGVLKAKKSAVKAYLGNALDLSQFEDNSFDVTLLFGPMYHLLTDDEKIRALQEAKRVTKVHGHILVAYCMNEFCVLTYGFKENHIRECLEDGRLDENFHSIPNHQDLYSYVRLEDVERYNRACQLKRVKVISADGPSNYMRPILNQMDEETYELFIRYHLSTCERYELLGAGEHIVDILEKIDDAKDVLSIG